MVSKQVGSAAPTTYEYNQLGNLKKVTLPSSSVISYSLDGYQRRAIRQVDALPRDFYTHEGPLKVVGSLTEGTSTSLKTYIFGADGNSPEYIRYQGADLRVIKDHLGSVRLIVNASTGTIVQRIDYNDIGGVVSDTNLGFQPYGFAGGMYDYQTGLVKFAAREYNPEVGRWTSKDSILFGGRQTNLYGYTFADPVNFIDPTGTIGWGGAIIGGVIGGISGYLTGISTGANPAQAALAGAAIGAASGFTGAYLIEGAALGLGYSSGAQMAIDGAFGTSLIPIDLLLAR